MARSHHSNEQPSQRSSIPGSEGSVSDRLERLSLNQSSTSLSMNDPSQTPPRVDSASSMRTPQMAPGTLPPSPRVPMVGSGMASGDAFLPPPGSVANDPSMFGFPHNAVNAQGRPPPSPYLMRPRPPDSSMQPNYYSPRPYDGAAGPRPLPHPHAYSDQPVASPYMGHLPPPTPHHFAPLPPPPGTPMQPYPGYYMPPPPPSLAMDQPYLPDSSLAAAASAGKRPPKPSKFPPATRENINLFRSEAEKSDDPQKLLDFAEYLLEAVQQVRIDDPKRAKKAKDALSQEAQKIVKKLASHSGMGKVGYPEAQFYLANCYGSGRMLLEKDADKAFSLYIQGSKQSHPACTYRAAVCYEKGLGTKSDNSRAIQFYRKAANLGDPDAMYKLGMVTLHGFLGQQKQPREGVSWLKRAVQGVDESKPHALHELALVYEQDGIPSIIPDLDYARDLYSQAAQYGYAPSQFKLGMAYENGLLNCPVDPRRSIAWYSAAAEQGDPESELALSGWYLTGSEGVLQQNDTEAYLWARKAADQSYAKAEYACGYYTETGIGVRQNLDESKKWYMRAAAQSYRQAMHRLAEIKKNGGNRPQQRQKHTRNANGGSMSGANGKDADCSIM